MIKNNENKISGDIGVELVSKIKESSNNIEGDVIIIPNDNSHIYGNHNFENDTNNFRFKFGKSSDSHHNHYNEQFHFNEHHHHHHNHKGELKNEMLPFLIGVLIFGDALLCSYLYDAKFLTIILYASSYLILGYNILLSTMSNLKNSNFFDENFLMTLATFGSFALGEYSEAVGVVLFFRIGELFEEYAISKSKKAITDVAKLKVEEADVLIDGEFKRIHSDKIKIGDILRIKVGERIAVDGIIESGDTKMDTSAVNGEPILLSVKQGDKVFSGFINISEICTLKAIDIVANSMISKIANAVEDASSKKPKIDRVITRFSKIYTPIVILTALITSIVPSIITGNWKKWIYSGLTFLVISCPCAFVLSVPLAFFSGIGAASKMGILFKGGNAIEALGKVKVIVFDKTGTLTNGIFSITDVKSYGNIKERDLLSICGSCEQNSTHPIAESITDYCKKNEIKIFSLDKVKEIAGRGISAIYNGKDLLCGNEKLMSENNILIPDKDKTLGCLVYIAINNKIEGRIIVSDCAKKTSLSSISQLKEMGIKTSMLTGDKSENANAMANYLGMDSFKGDLLPEGKLAEIEKIRLENGEVMFVGDGINDGPVLAGADVGGAMYNGSDLALVAADAVFMNSEPESIVKAKKIAEKTLVISYENIIFALLIKGFILLLGIFGHPNMWLAVFADSGSGVLLILNSIRVLNIKNYN
jgi:Cd2+/Zn2+-exporting ATPase